MSDLISRQEAIKAIKELIDEDDPYDEGYNLGLNSAILELKHRIPSAEKVGKWIETHKGILDSLANILRCSECGALIIEQTTAKRWHYCPNCGAKMERSE